MNIPNNQSTLDSWVDWLLHLHAQEIDLGLSRIRVVAEQMQLKNPAPTVITVAGTNGKGSSVAMLSAIYKAAGYRVGTYTSPHIVSFTERVQINGVPVSETDIVHAFTEIEQQRAQIKLTYFEFSTLAALKVFTEKELDVVVLEVGLGGRLDAVNVIDADASLITAIDIDHIDWLGDDRSVIATEKAGVMRKGQISVCSDPQPPVSLLEYATNLSVNLSILNRDYSFQTLDKAWSLSDQDGVNQYDLPALQGDFQVQNAAGVVTLVHKLCKRLPVTTAGINRGLQQVRHPGRMEQKKVDHQQWLIDVAHNPQSAEVLGEFLAKSAMYDQVAIFSALNDKDMLPMVKVVAPFVKEWYIADLNIPRASSVEQLNEILQAAGVESERIHSQKTIAAAVNEVKLLQLSQVLVWGSFFTVSQVMQTLSGEPS